MEKQADMDSSEGNIIGAAASLPGITQLIMLLTGTDM
jgi:hypothetical protein